MTSTPTTGYWHNRVTRRRLLGASAVSAGAIAVSAACGSGSSSSKTPASGSTATAGTSPAAGGQKGGRLKVGANVDLMWSNPPYQLNTPYLVSQFAIYDTLFRYDTLELQPKPRLAQSYEFNGDQSVLTVTLRPNLTFHSGKVLDAQAVVDSFNSLTDKNTPSNQPSGLAKAYVTSVAATDPTHVTFTLKRPGMLVFDLFNFWLIADAANIAEMQTGGLPNGSGPFKVTEVKPKQGGTLDRFPGYYSPALLDGIDYKVYPDPSSLAIAVQSGDVDLSKDLSIDDALRFAKDSKYHVLKDKGLTADNSFGMNCKGDVTKDPRIRQALYHAVDRQNIVETVYLGQSTPVNCLWPKGSPAYESRYDKDPYDLQKAKSLVAEAGYSNGTPPIEIIIPTNQPTAPQIMQLVQASAKQAGLNLTLKTEEDTVFVQQFLKAAYPGCYANAFGFNTMHPDSLPVMNYQVRVPNAAGYDSADYDKLQAEMAAATTADARKALYAQFNKIWDNDMWVFLTCSQTFQWLTKKAIGGFTVNDFSVPLMEKISLT